MSHFNQASYIKSYPGYEETLDDLPSFFMLGRSNVGKSSLINALLNRKQLARTSSNPGKTIAINYYRIDDAFYFLDAPGYGYAKRSKTDREGFYDMLNAILLKQTLLKKVIMIIDFKVGPTKDDLDVFHQLERYEKDVIVVATKIDKIPKTKRPSQLKAILTLMPTSIYMVSNETKEGLETLKVSIIESL
jgi:GTP-binding protein